MSYGTQTHTQGRPQQNQNAAPRIPPGNYVGKIGDPTIVADTTQGKKVQFKFRVDLYKRGSEGKANENVGALIHFCSMASAEALRISVETFEAFIDKPNRAQIQADLKQIITGNRTTLTGFGSAQASCSLKYEMWEGKQRPRLSIWKSGVTAKNAPDASTASRAASELDAMFAVMGEKTSAAAGASGGGLDLGDDDATNDPAAQSAHADCGAEDFNFGGSDNDIPF